MKALAIAGPRRDALALLLATATVVPLAKLVGLSPILGFLATGVYLGPSGRNFISSMHQTEILGELGVVFFLFEMGLELSVAKIGAMRTEIFGLGLAQFLATTAVLAKGAPDERDLVWARRRLGATWDARTWPRVRDAVRGVARLARRDDSAAWPGPTRPPKIVGLDFAVDAAGDAWLLEVNRTPGLVGRADVDRAVKDAVVDATWGCASADILEELLL